MNQYTKTVEKWNVFEIRTQGRTDGNPFAEYEIRATFTGAKEQKTILGFYDGDGEYVVRFMPSSDYTLARFSATESPSIEPISCYSNP